MSNVTAAACTGDGQLTVYPDGVATPPTTTVSFATSKTVPELVVVGVGTDGKVAFTNSSGETVQIIADVEGRFRTTMPLTGVDQIVSNGGMVCGRLGSGGVDCWGENSEGSLGAGVTSGPNVCVIDAVHHVNDNCSPVPLQVHGVGNNGTLTDATDVVPTVDGACAAESGGGVDCWGGNLEGELGNGTANGPATCGGFFPCAPSPEPVVDANGSGTLANVTELAGDGGGSCARLSSGGVDCWGDNSIGELGDGTTTTRDVPTPVVGIGGSGTLSNVTDVESSGVGTGYCVVLSSGGVDCWGGSSTGQLGNGTTNGPWRVRGEIAPPCTKTPVAVKGVGGSGTLANVREHHSGRRRLVRASDNGRGRLLGRQHLRSGRQRSNDRTADLHRELESISVRDDFRPSCWRGRLGHAHPRHHVDDRRHRLVRVLDTGGLNCWGDNSTGELGISTRDGPDACIETKCSAAPVVVKGVSGVGTLAGVTSVTGFGLGTFCADPLRQRRLLG